MLKNLKHEGTGFWAFKFLVSHAKKGKMLDVWRLYVRADPFKINQ